MDWAQVLLPAAYVAGGWIGWTVVSRMIRKKNDTK